MSATAPLQDSFQFHIPVSKDFAWEITVRSFGFYLMAPNSYDATAKVFARPLAVVSRDLPENSRRSDEEPMVFQVSISHDVSLCALLVSAAPSAGARTVDRLGVEEQLRRQIVRMFRLDVDLAPFHVVFPAAKEVGFGRTFRSPSLFEDVVKTITGCNTSFSNTRMMNQLLCQHFGTCGAFPSPHQVAKRSAQELRDLCRVGYRDKRIFLFAKQIIDGTFPAAWFDEHLTSAHWGLDVKQAAGHRELVENMKERLRAIHGFGPFSVNNAMQLLGVFDAIPVDTESRRVVAPASGKKPHTPKQLEELVKARFSPYTPYQFLVYWFVLYKYGERFNSTANEAKPLWTTEEARVQEEKSTCIAPRKRKNEHAET